MSEMKKKILTSVISIFALIQACPTQSVEPKAKADVSELLTALKAEKYAHIRKGIIELVEEIGNREPISFFVEQLQADNRRRRCKAALCLELLGDRRGVPAIIKELNDTSYRPTTMIKSDGTEYQQGQIRSDRYYAALLLGILGDEEAVPPLIEATRDETINYQAAISLGEIGDKRAIPALRAMLKKYSNQPFRHTTKHFRRVFAGYGLAMLGDAEGLKVVIDTLNERQQDWTIRRHATEALGKLGDKQAVPNLIAALKDEHPNIRVSAARALGAIGDVSALPALEEALKDKTETKVNAPTTVSKAAASAIAQIKGWGKTISGLRCWLRADKDVWKADETPTFKADVYNDGAREFYMHQGHELCELVVDEQWYYWSINFNGPVGILSPGQQYNNIWISLEKYWQNNQDNEQLTLAVGKHTIRVVFVARPSVENSGPPLRVLSNRVEIRILPTEL